MTPTKTKVATCEELIYFWRLRGSMLDVIRGVARKLQHPLDNDSLDALKVVMFGSQFIGYHWHVRTWVAAIGKELSDALFDGKDDDHCMKIALATTLRRKTGVSWSTKGGTKSTHANMPILMRDLSKKHDWNVCK